jgi:LysM repeat protein
MLFTKNVFLLMLVLISANIVYAQNKQLCEVEVEGVSFSLHLVEVGDNLFRIAQKYNSTVLEIWKNNPTIMDSIIIPGQVLKVPTNIKPATSTSREVINSEDKMSAKPKPIIPSQKIDSSKIVYHEVEQGQTLYSISRNYSTSVEQLREWNKLGDNNIKLGQKLIVSPYGSVKVFEIEKKNNKEDIIVVTEITPSQTPVKQTIEVNNQMDNLQQAYAQSAIGRSEHLERGTAAWIPTGSQAYANKYLALHKTAPIGTVLKVTNLINKKYAFVKVIGKLPDTGDNKNVHIRLSESAKKDLVLLDDKSLVQIQYYK